MERISRRRLMSDSAVAALTAGAAMAARPNHSIAADKANDKVVLALVGAGGRGTALANGFASLSGSVEFKYVCDLDATRGVKAMKDLTAAQGKAPQRINDMRQALDDKDVDGIISATPDHWHALSTIWACQAGKDVYVEKNLAYSIYEGRKMVEAARKYKRVVQCGLQMRSSPYADAARDYIASGKLGKVVCVKVYNLLNGGAWKAQPDADVPATVNWDMWLGHRPAVAYNAGRHRGWYNWYEYCGGDLGNDCSHQLDLMRHVLGDPATPRHVYCHGGHFAYNSKRPVPELQVVTYEYPDFTVECSSGTFPSYLRKSTLEERTGGNWPKWAFNNERIEIYGTKQLMYLGRHGVGYQVMEADGKIVAEEKGYHPDKFHQPNFVQCIRSRKLPNADVEKAHTSGLLSHLGNIAYRLGNQRLEFDGSTERFVTSEAANQLIKPEFRDKYRIPDPV